MRAVNARFAKERARKYAGFASLPPARVTEIARLGGAAVARCALCDAGFPLKDGYHIIPAKHLGMIPVTRCEKERKRAHMARIGSKGGKGRAGWRKARPAQ